MTAITLPLWIYLLAISGIGNVSASFQSKPFENIIKSNNGEYGYISSGGGGGQPVHQREIRFTDHTTRADV